MSSGSTRKLAVVTWWSWQCCAMDRSMLRYSLCVVVFCYALILSVYLVVACSYCMWLNLLERQTGGGLNVFCNPPVWGVFYTVIMIYYYYTIQITSEIHVVIALISNLVELLTSTSSKKNAQIIIIISAILSRHRREELNNLSLKQQQNSNLIFRS